MSPQSHPTPATGDGQSSQADSVTMSGGGAYSLATIGAKDVIDGAEPMVQKALRLIAVNRSGFTFSDMGCADGGTSLAMVGAVLQTVRARNPEAPISIVYADQPRNDFNALVQIVHGLTDFESYLDRIDNVYPLVSGTSFYRQIVPPATLDLGFSATAMHWLSRKPCNLSNHVHAVGAVGDEREQFAKQGRQDWQTILLHRARELKPGGYLVLVNFGRDEQEHYLGNTGGINMFDTFNAIWRELVDENAINEAEYVNMTLPQYYNSVAEFSSPLTDTGSAVYQAGLRLESIETRIVRCPFARDFEQHGDAEKFARAYIPTIRSWNESTFFAGLATTRPMPERQAIIADYYDRYRRRVVASPEGHAMDYVHAYMVIRKEQEPTQP